MKIYWGVIRIWYVSTACKSNDILLQYYYMNGNGKVLSIDTVSSNFQASWGCPFLSLWPKASRVYCDTPPLCEMTFPWLIFFSVFDALCSSMIVPLRNHKCEVFTRWPIASINSNHEWRNILADESWRIHQVYFVKWRSTYVNSP